MSRKRTKLREEARLDNKDLKKLAKHIIDKVGDGGEAYLQAINLLLLVAVVEDQGMYMAVREEIRAYLLPTPKPPQSSADGSGPRGIVGKSCDENGEA